MNSPEFKINLNSISDLTVNDIIFFIKFNFKLLSISCLLGIILSIIFIFNEPKVYSGHHTMMLGKVTNPSTYPGGLLIEDTSLIILKLKYQAKISEECKSKNKYFRYLKFPSVEIKTSKNISNALDFFTTQNSQIQVSDCLNELSNLLIKYHLDTTKSLIKDYDDMIENQNLIIKNNKNILKSFKLNDFNNLLYVTTVNELNKSQSLILELIKMKSFFLNNQPYVIGDIQISDKPINSYLIRIIFGFLLGLIIGTSIILFKAHLRKS